MIPEKLNRSGPQGGLRGRGERRRGQRELRLPERVEAGLFRGAHPRVLSGAPNSFFVVHLAGVVANARGLTSPDCSPGADH